MDIVEFLGRLLVILEIFGGISVILILAIYFSLKNKECPKCNKSFTKYTTMCPYCETKL